LYTVAHEILNRAAVVDRYGAPEAFPIGEKMNLKFRTKVLNIFNQAIDANPSGSIGLDPANPSASLGLITSQLNTAAAATGTSHRVPFALPLDS